AGRDGAWRLGDCDETKRVSRRDGVIGPVGREHGDIEVVWVGGIADLAQDLAVGANLALGVGQQCDMQVGIAVQDVVAGATADAVATSAAEENIAAEVAGRLY